MGKCVQWKKEDKSTEVWNILEMHPRQESKLHNEIRRLRLQDAGTRRNNGWRFVPLMKEHKSIQVWSIPQMH
jgi:hypothetical protein